MQWDLQVFHLTSYMEVCLKFTLYKCTRQSHQEPFSQHVTVASETITALNATVRSARWVTASQFNKRAFFGSIMEHHPNRCEKVNRRQARQSDVLLNV